MAGAAIERTAERVASADELASLVEAFNGVTANLQATQERLHAEVARLRGQLAEAHDQLERTRQLAALGEMAAGIAHEVRNPLGSIKLYAQALVEDLAAQPAERDVARRIEAATDRLNAVVGDVLAFASDRAISREPVLAGDLLNGARESCAGIIEQLEIELSADVGSQIVVRCDRSLAMQAVTNVLRNACEAAAEGDGRVELRVEPRRVLRADAESAAMVAVIVRDSGPGIPAAVLDRMFNPFYTTRATGTGLGLAITHRIMDAHDGRVVARNRAAPGWPGASFELLFPAEGGNHAIGEETSDGDGPGR